VQRWFCKGRLI